MLIFNFQGISPSFIIELGRYVQWPVSFFFQSDLDL